MTKDLEYCSLNEAWSYSPPVKVSGFNSTSPAVQKNGSTIKTPKMASANALYDSFDSLSYAEKQRFIDMLNNTYSTKIKPVPKPSKPVKRAVPNPAPTPVSEPVVASMHNETMEEENKAYIPFDMSQDTFHLFILIVMCGVLYYALD